MPKKDNEIPFLITIAYFLAFITIRIMVLIAGSAESEFAQVAKQGLTPETDFYIGRNIILFGYHIHHFYFGILLIAIAAWIAIVGSKYFTRRHAALIYGAGLGLFMDEIGLLLTWGDYYSSLTYLLSLLLGGIFLNIVFFPYFWKEVKQNIKKTNPSGFIWDVFSNHNSFMEVADTISDKTGKTEKASLTFTGIAYLIVGFLILTYPQFLVYWVAGLFFLQGLSSLINAWQKKKDEEAN